MTKTERVRAALTGAQTDRPPFTLWYHFRREPDSGEGFVRATLEFYRQYDPDLLKVMNDTPYEMPVEAPLIKSVADWKTLPLNPPDAGCFGERLRSLRHIAEGRGEDAAPVVETIHSVYSTARNLTQDKVLEHLSEDPQAVTAGLQRLAASLAGYAKAAVEEAGCAGIFLAVTGADAHHVPADRYADVFLPLDQLILGSASTAASEGGWCNVVHLHGDDLHLDALSPLTEMANAVSWSDRASGPSLSEMRQRTGRCLMGGVNEQRIGGYSPQQVAEEIADALAQTGGGSGLIVAPGCAVPTETPPANLTAFKSAAESAAGASGR